MSRFIGYMAARDVVRGTAKEMQDDSQESQAAAVGDLKEFQKAQANEFSGFMGSIHEISQNHQHVADAITLGAKGNIQWLTSAAQKFNQADSFVGGIKSAITGATRYTETADQQQQETANAMQDQERLKTTEKEQSEARKAREKFQGEVAKQKEELGDTTGDEVSRMRDKAREEYEQRVAQAKTMEVGDQGSDYKAQGFKSVGEQQQSRHQLLDIAGKEYAAKEALADAAEQKQNERAAKEKSAAEEKVAREQAAAQKVADERAAVEEESQGRATEITKRAGADREKAEGDSVNAARDEKFAALDDGVAKAREAMDKETDAAKKVSLEKVLSATQAAAASEKQSFNINADRQEKEKVDDIDASTAESRLKFAGRGDDAKMIEDERKAQKEMDEAKKSGNNAEADAIGDNLTEKKQEYQYGKAEQQHGRDVQEKEGEYRANGQGEAASYMELNERDQDRIRKAEMGGDKNAIAQEKRMAANDIKGFKNEHQEKSQTFGSMEEYVNAVDSRASQGNNGLDQAMKMANSDLKSLKGGGDLTPMTGSDKSMNDQAKSVGDSIQAQLKDLFKHAPKLWVLPDGR